MALRAGYYGVKRRIKDKIEDIAGAWDTTIASLFPRDEQAILGAKQLFKPSALTVNGITVSVNADDSIDVSGTPTASTTSVRIFNPGVLLKKGSYRATLISGTGIPSNATLQISTVIGGNWSRIAMANIGEDALFTLNADDIPIGITIGMTVTAGTAVSMSNIKVLITLASDTDRTFAPYAMTNQELTASAADQKTAINAIITAATGAADFAAFKTAMGAITPVTRSLYIEGTTEPDSKTIAEEPVVEKKTTKKKSTAKAETTEEV